METIFFYEKSEKTHVRKYIYKDMARSVIKDFFVFLLLKRMGEHNDGRVFLTFRYSSSYSKKNLKNTIKVTLSISTINI